LKTILVFGAGKSATVLIDYLKNTCAEKNWKLIVADSNLQQAQAKLGSHSHAQAVEVNVTDADERRMLIESADIVISLLPPFLHIHVVKDCVAIGRNLLNASYVDEAIKNLEAEINSKELLFLCEMGLDPGIDHMSAMQLFDDIRSKGGKITSFKSHCGGLVAPESDDNPWHYKISWNPRNIVMAGQAGAAYKKKNEIIRKEYTPVFEDCQPLEVDDIPMLAHTHGQPASPNRLGKEIMVFVERIKYQIEQFIGIPFTGKLVSYTGNFNPHPVTIQKNYRVKTGKKKMFN